MKKEKYLVYFLIAVGVLARLIPHPYNFAPIGAIALFSGMYLPKKWSIIVPLAAMLLGDVYIGLYSWKMLLSVYLSFALIGAIGIIIGRNKSFLKVFGGTLLGSIIFYLITNFAVWAFGGMYTIDLSGLIHCYYMAIPFFRNTVVGDLFYSGVLIGSYEYLSSRSFVLKTKAIKIQIYE